MIDWTKKKKSLQKVKKATDITQSTVKKIQKDYKPIEEYKPTGSFVYDQGSMTSLEEKTKQILHVGKLNI